jgi:hypothetical protein
MSSPPTLPSTVIIISLFSDFLLLSSP